MLDYIPRPMRWLRHKIRRGKTNLAFRLEHERQTHRSVSLWIHNQAPAGAGAALADAIDLVARADPVSFSRLSHVLPGGIAASATNWAVAWYNRPAQRCFIGANALKRGTATDLALYIIHEMTHARLADFETGTDHALRVREEKICVRRELAFTRKLETLGFRTASYRADEIRDYLDDFPAHLYENSHFHASDRRAMLEKLRLLKQFDIPRWLRRVVVLRLRRKLRAHRTASAKLQMQDTAR